MNTVKSMSTTALPATIAADPNSAALGEQAWIEVIQKMDEVYNDLLQYEVALEEKNAALEESHQFIESVLTSMSDILIVCDRHGSIEEVNSSLCHFSGKTADELLKQPLFDLFADEAEQQGRGSCLRALRVKACTICELFLRAGDGSTVPVSINCTPRVSQTGKLMGVVVTGRPVGELRRAYQALRQAHDDLKRTQGQLLHAEKMVSLGRLVAGVAHELNNPISFVLGNVLSLQRYSQRLESYLTAVHATDVAEDSALKAACASYGLTAFWPTCRTDRRHDRRRRAHPRHRRRAEALFAAVNKMSPEQVSLNEVIERSVRWVVQSASAKFAVNVDLPPEFVLLRFLRPVAAGGHESGPERLRCDGLPGDGRLRISGTVADGMVEPALCRQRPGDSRRPIWGACSSPSSPPSRSGRGPGFGLSISYSIVERHGGKLSASNAEAAERNSSLHLPVQGQLTR